MKWNCFLSVIFFLVVSASHLVSCANILCLFGVACSSHHHWNLAISQELVAKGHNLTILSADSEENSNYTHYLPLDNLYPTYFDNEDGSLDYSEISAVGLLGGIVEFYNFGIVGCKGIISSTGFKALRNYPKNFKFDLIIHDFTIGPCLLGFLDQFPDASLVGVSAFNNPPFSVQMVGGHKQFSYVPHYLLRLGTGMSLQQRLINSGLYLIDEFYRRFVAYPKIAQSMKIGFGRSFGNLLNLEAQHEILLVNSHYSSDFPESLPPNIIPVGGLHIPDQIQDIPQEIKSFISKGSNGFILFSIGSAFEGKNLTPKIVSQFLESFRELKELQILWKFESDSIKGDLPENVKILSWLPQNDLLADKDIRLFISHAGLLSVHETIYHGVPVLAFPLFTDQHRNAGKLAEDGGALVLDIHNISSTGITATIRQMMTDKSFQEKMQIKSTLFRDREEHPLTRAIWWMEWILRNPKHLTDLKAPTQTLGFFVANSLDVGVIYCLLLLLIPYVGITAMVLLGRVFTKQPLRVHKWKTH